MIAQRLFHIPLSALGAVCLAAFASALAPSGALAQARDYERDREPASTASSGPSKDFTLTLSMPFLWTSSVVGVDSENRIVNRSDWHAYPELSLKWSHQYDWVKLSAFGAVAIDRYHREKSADISQIESGAKATFTDGKSDLFVPYLSYNFISYYDRDFVSLNDRRHDLWAGFTSGIGTRGGRVIGYSDATRPGDSSYGIELYGGRRFANEEDDRHNVLGVTLDYTYVVRNDLSLVLTPKFRVRWFDDIAGEPSRRDVRLSAIGKAVWKPEWLRQVLPKSELQFSVEYQRNNSTIPEARYKYWEIGPTVKLATQF